MLSFHNLLCSLSEQFWLVKLTGRTGEDNLHFLYRGDSLVEILHFLVVSFLKDVIPFVKNKTFIQVCLYCCISGFHGFFSGN